MSDTKPAAPIRLADNYRIPLPAELPDNLDPETRGVAELNERRVAAIVGLRNLAKLLAENPDLPVPYSIVAQAGPMGGDWDKQREIVTAAADLLGQPLTVDDETRSTVHVKLSRSGQRPRVTYTVHASRDDLPAGGAR
jgi:hypothetical protein